MVSRFRPHTLFGNERGFVVFVAYCNLPLLLYSTTEKDNVSKYSKKHILYQNPKSIVLNIWKIGLLFGSASFSMPLFMGERQCIF